MDPHHINDVLFSAEQIKTRVAELVDEIAADYQDQDVVLAGILRGSFMFIADLVRGLHHHALHPRIDFITLESYGSATRSSGVVRVTKDIHVDVHDADVLLLDDILDTGRTLRFAVAHLKNKGARTVRSCAFLDKPSCRIMDIQADYVGFSIEDAFVVGYGLDYDSRYRELPFVAKVTFTGED